MYGYSGKILSVNLGKRKNYAEVQNLDVNFARRYIGGLGFGARIVYDEVPGDLDAFDPKNVLVFAVGPLTGSPWPSSVDYVVSSKSPLVCNPDTLVGAWGDAEAKGQFGTRMKAAGYDTIVITGKASKPVYLHVTEGSVELKDASHFWGKGTYETCDIIRKELGGDVAVACIGPAGEKLVRFACIMSTPDHYAGRCGLGAVMGSKNLKAIAVEGEKTVELAAPEKLNGLVREVLPKLFDHPHTKDVIEATTAGSVEACDVLGDLPEMNWRLGQWPEGAGKISGSAMNRKWGRGRRFCRPYCTIGCKRDIKFEREYGPVKPFFGAGPEYETCAMLGAMNLIDDIDAVVAGNHLCNDLGIDTISAGGTAAYAFECYERGVLTKKDTDGLELKWGNGEALLWLLWKMGNREGIGNLLAEGSYRASKKLEKGSEEWSITVKGAELPGHDPRALDVFAIEYAISPRGANHTEVYSYLWESIGAAEGPGYAGSETADKSIGVPFMIPRWHVEGKGRAAALGQNFRIFFASLGVCLHSIYNIKFEDYCKAYNFATGANQTNDEIMRSLDRINNLRKAFNCRCGLTAKHDYLPKRILTLARDKSLSSGHVPDLQPMIKEYYEFRGWDIKTGKPKKEKLIELGLEDVAKQLYG